MFHAYVSSRIRLIIYSQFHFFSTAAIVLKLGVWYVCIFSFRVLEFSSPNRFFWAWCLNDMFVGYIRHLNSAEACCCPHPACHFLRSCSSLFLFFFCEVVICYRCRSVSHSQAGSWSTVYSVGMYAVRCYMRLPAFLSQGSAEHDVANTSASIFCKEGHALQETAQGRNASHAKPR